MELPEKREKAIPPWLEENTEEQTIVMFHETYSALITKNLDKLTKVIDLSDLWCPLRTLKVVDRTSLTRIQKSSCIEADQVTALLKWLETKQTWKLHGFFKALCDTGQEHVVKNILGLNPECYKEPSTRTSYEGGEGGAGQVGTELPAKVKKGIEGHQEYYSKTLMKGHLFDIEEFDLPYDMENCYIQIVATSDEQLVNPKSIHPDKVMSADPDKPPLKSAVLQGPPGAGKSSFVRHYAYKWSQLTKGKQAEEQKMWDLVVVLPVSTLRLSQGKGPKDQIYEAIKHNLAGSEVEAIMRHMENSQMKVLIIPDGLDECRSEATLEMLRYLVEQCHKNVLPFSVFVTCRSGLCSIKQSLFERRMKIDGFTLDQGIEYVKKYYSDIKKPDDDTILKYISNSRGKLDHILGNPLRAHIFSVVTADGTLKLKKGQTLSLKELLRAMELSMKRRQLEKERRAAESPQEKLHEEDDIEVQTNNFYKLSLYSLLKGIRVFDDKLLQKFSVWNTSPYFSFMMRNERRNVIIGKVTEWHFTHEMFHEYLATCALESLPLDDLEYFLIHICSRSDFRNTQQILFSALGEDLDYADLLADMLKATVLLQCEEEISNISERVDSMTEDTDPLDILLPEGKASVLDDRGSKDERASTEAELWKDIRFHFTNKVVTSRDIFTQFRYDTDLLSHIYDCLREVPEENQQRLFYNSIGCLLPLKRGLRTWYMMDGCRWSSMVEGKTELILHAWSPADASQLIQQHGQPHHPDWTTQHDDTDKQEPQQTQVVTRQDGGQDNRNTGIGNVRCINVHIPSAGEETSYSGYSYRWGAPPEQQLRSPRAWLEMLGEMSQHWRIRVGYLIIWWDDFCRISVKGLLDALLLEDTQHYLKQLLVEKEGGWRDVILWEGHIDSSCLCEWVGRYTQQSVVRVVVMHLNCNISEDKGSSSEGKVAAAARAIEDTVLGGKKLFEAQYLGPGIILD